MNISSFLTNLALEIKETIHFFRIQDFYHAQAKLSNIYNQIDTLINEIYPEISSDILSQVESIFSAQQSSDNVLIADLLEINLLTTIEGLLHTEIISREVPPKTDHFESNISALTDSRLANQIIQHNKKFAEQTNLLIETTNIGLPTLKFENEKKSLYYHSNIDPVNEAKSLACYYAKKDCLDYSIWGFGLGYHVQALLEYDRRFQVTCVETNLSVLVCAFHSCDLTALLKNPRFTLQYCELEKSMDYIECKSPSTLLVHAPSLFALNDSKFKTALANYFMQISSMYAQEQKLRENFYYNTKHEDDSIVAIKDNFRNKDVIFVAGGPSVEYYIDFLREKSHSENTTIICASTIYKKLLENNITPEFTIMIDAQDNLIHHVEGAPKTSTRLIYLCTASSQAVNLFKGKRYICFQRNYLDAEKYASSHQIPLIQTGGTVSSAAIDLILQFDAKSLTTIGLDLAFTNNKRHSFDAVSANNSDLSLPTVRSVTGELIPTANNFNIYREWIEKRIASTKNIELINLSHGAYIKGMKNKVSPDSVPN